MMIFYSRIIPCSSLETITRILTEQEENFSRISTKEQRVTKRTLTDSPSVYLSEIRQDETTFRLSPNTEYQGSFTTSANIFSKKAHYGSFTFSYSSAAKYIFITVLEMLLKTLSITHTCNNR